MRHTAATLMLASGENPEWVAMVLGHTTTEMLFRVYSRFVPNLTRQDGRAFAGLINSHSAEPKAKPALDIDTMDADALRRELKSLLTRQSPQEVRTH
jgi:integrase